MKVNYLMGGKKEIEEGKWVRCEEIKKEEDRDTEA
jgi:hypothetical protein